MVQDMRTPESESGASVLKMLEFKSQTAKFLLQSLHYAVAFFVPAGISFLSTVMYTRLFEVEQYGIYSLVVSSIGLSATVFAHWLQQAVTRYLPGVPRDEAFRVLRATCVGMAFIASVVVLVALLIAGLRVLPDSYDEYVFPAAGAMLTGITAGVALNVFQSRFRTKTYMWFNVLLSFSNFVASLCLILYFVYSPLSVICGTILGSSCVICLAAIVFRKQGYRLGWLWPDAGTLLYLKKMVLYGLPMLGWLVAANLLNISDRFLIGFFKGSEEVGIYTANYSLTSGIAGLLTPVLATSHPVLMSAWAENDVKKTSNLIGTIASHFLSIGIVVIGGTWLFYGPFSSIMLGEHFRSGSFMMPILIAGMIAWSFAMFAHKPFEFKERTEMMMFVAIGTAVVNIALNVVFIPLFGYVSAAWTTLGCYLLYAVVTVIIGQRMLKWNIRWNIVIRTAISVICAAALIRLVVEKILRMNVIVETVLCFFVYIAVSLLPIVWENRTVLGDLFRRRRFDALEPHLTEGRIVQ